MNQRFRKFATTGMAAAIMLSMGATSFATDFFTEYPNLTNYNTDYNYTVEKGSGTKDQALMVQGATSNWYGTSLFNNLADADSINWNIVQGSTDAVSVSKQAPESVANQFAAKGNATIDKSKNAGVAVVEATNKTNGYMDFTVVLNPTSAQQDVSGVNVRAYDASSGSFKFLKTSTGNVSTSAVKSNINYPTAMDAISVVADSFTYDVQWGSEFLKNVTINNKNYPYMENELGWMYRVYDSTGTATSEQKMVDVSEKVGGETFDVESGQTVVWAYGDYSVQFPENLSELPNK